MHNYRRQHKSLLRQHHRNNPNRLDLIFGMIRHVRMYLCVKISVLLQVFHILRRLSVPFSVSFSFFTIEDLKNAVVVSRENRERANLFLLRHKFSLKSKKMCVEHISWRVNNVRCVKEEETEIEKQEEEEIICN